MRFVKHFTGVTGHFSHENDWILSKSIEIFWSWQKMKCNVHSHFWWFKNYLNIKKSATYITLSQCGFMKNFKRTFLTALHEQCISILCFPFRLILHMKPPLSNSLQKSINHMTPRNRIQQTALACNITLALSWRTMRSLKLRNNFVQCFRAGVNSIASIFKNTLTKFCTDFFPTVL